MIISFACRDTERLFLNRSVPRFSNFLQQARLKLKLLNAAHNVNDLRSPPGNRLEILQGDRKGQYSIRINNKWRLCFIWKNGNAYSAEIVDYH